jgi:pectin methylesterase-like acyl-CoA thioesterase
MRFKKRFSMCFALVAAASLLALPQAAVARQAGLNAVIQADFDKDRIKTIVKATSAAAMARACAPLVIIKPGLAASLKAVLRANDKIFGQGTSKSEIAKKIKEHEDENDCGPLTEALRLGLYPNSFLRPRK